MRMITKQDGMTLIELMIVVAIIGILVGIGYPNYTRYAVRTKRAEAISNMMELTQWMERYYSENGKYHQDNSTPAVAVSLPFTTSPRDGGTLAYNIALGNLAATTYTLTATPQGGQATNDSDCGTLSITHAGVKCINNGSSSCSNGNAAAKTAVADCF